MNYRDLQSELENDPLGYYAGLDNAQKADKINGASRARPVRSTSNGDVLAAIDSSEFNALNASNTASLQLLLTPQALDLTNTNIIADITNVFATGSASNPAIFALSTTNKTRSAELGFGIVNEQMIETALAGRG